MLRTQVVGGQVEQQGFQPLVHPTSLAATTGSSSHGLPKFTRQKAIGIGTTLIVAAVLGMIMNVIDIMNPNDYGSVGDVGHGFWVGAVVSIIERYCLCRHRNLKTVVSCSKLFGHRCTN